MTQYEILKLAHTAQLEIWGKEIKRLSKLPDNSHTQAREIRAWQTLKEIEAMMIEAAFKAE